MSQHTHHPDSHVHGLADDCPRCAEHAEHPFVSLDDNNLRVLVDRTVAWMRDEPGARPRSKAEHVAMRNVEQAIYKARTLVRLGGI